MSLLSAIQLNERALKLNTNVFLSHRRRQLSQHGYNSMICDYCKIFFILRYVSNGSAHTRQDL